MLNLSKHLKAEQEKDRNKRPRPYNIKHVEINVNLGKSETTIFVISCTDIVALLLYRIGAYDTACQGICVGVDDDDGDGCGGCSAEEFGSEG